MKEILDDDLFIKIFLTVIQDIKLFDPVTNADFRVPKEIDQQKQLLNYFLYQPDFVMVWSDVMTYAHLNVWKQLINDSKFKFCITAPSMKGKKYEDIGLKNVPFYAWDEGFQHSKFLSCNSNLSALFYFVNKAKNNSFITKYRNQLHVHFHHGDSDKGGSANRLEEVFDYLVVTDNNAVGRYFKAGVYIDYGKFIPLGGTIYPNVEVNNGIKKIENILYAPTFEGWSESQNFSSIMRAGDKIISNKNIMVRSHHSIGSRDIEYKNKIKTIAKRSYKLSNDKSEQFNWSDAIITDISGVLSEYLFTNKIIILPISKTENLWIYNHAIKARLDSFCYFWDYNELSLDKFLESISSDPLYFSRLERRNQLYLGFTDYSDSLELFEATLSMFKLKHQYRLALQGQSLKNKLDVSKYPSEYQEIINDISEGKALFV